MDLQHRDITPEDYDTLRRLDKTVQPKTLSAQHLDKICPCWTMSSAPTAASAAATPAGCGSCSSNAKPQSSTGSPLTRAMASAFKMASAQPKSAEAQKADATPPDHGPAHDLCSICIEQFACGEHVRRLPCRHLFHKACIDEWLTTSSDLCPDCSQPVVDD